MDQSNRACPVGAWLPATRQLRLLPPHRFPPLCAHSASNASKLHARPGCAAQGGGETPPRQRRDAGENGASPAREVEEPARIGCVISYETRNSPGEMHLMNILQAWR